MFFLQIVRNIKLIGYEPSVEELKYSIGVGVTWITGFGPMSFSFSQPFNDGPFDRTEEFQFTIGQVF